MTDHTIHCRRDGDGSKETNGLGRGAQKNTSTAISQHESVEQKKRGQKSIYTIQCNRDSMKRACPFMQHHKSKTARVSNIFQGRTRILCISRKLQPQRLAMPIAISVLSLSAWIPHPLDPGLYQVALSFTVLGHGPIPVASRLTPLPGSRVNMGTKKPPEWVVFFFNKARQLR